MIQYLGTMHYAFKDHSPITPRQVGLFALVELGTLAGNALAFHVLVTLTPVTCLLARPVATLLVYVSFSYPLGTDLSQGLPHTNC